MAWARKLKPKHHKEVKQLKPRKHARHQEIKKLKPHMRRK